MMQSVIDLSTQQPGVGNPSKKYSVQHKCCSAVSADLVLLIIRLLIIGLVWPGLSLAVFADSAKPQHAEIRRDSPTPRIVQRLLVVRRLPPVTAGGPEDLPASPRAQKWDPKTEQELETPVRLATSLAADLQGAVEEGDSSQGRNPMEPSNPFAGYLFNEFAADFSPTPLPPLAATPGEDQLFVYARDVPVPTQRPWIEWGREFYGTGITPPGIDWFGPNNLVRPNFYLYGDFRTGISAGRNAAGRTDNWANRLNLDADLKITDTERLHGFIGPLNNGGSSSRWERVAGDLRFRNEVNFVPVTGFFEGDAGRMLGAAVDQPSPLELPIAVGLVPLLFQNGIWMEDAVTGAAISIPSQHSNLLNWSNYDATFFAVLDQINSPAFGADEHAAQAFGTAWFIEAYGGYIESGYAYLRDRNQSRRSYHNLTTSFTRRYFDRISNSVRVIVNTGQTGAESSRTADGVLLLIENSWVTADPLRVIPYFNVFVGWDRPQSVARAGVSGGILRNTGINFDTDGLNGFATLDPTGNDTAGFSLGVDLIGQGLDHQWIVETTYLTPNGGSNPLVRGQQYGLGTRYQFPISHRSLIRTDVMYGWRGGLDNVYGSRIEYRWKF